MWYTCVCSCSGWYTCLCAYKWKTEKDTECLLLLLFTWWYWNRVSRSGLAWLTSKLLSLPVSCLLKLWLQYVWRCPAFTWMLGIWTQVLKLGQHELISTEPFPGPCTHFFWSLCLLLKQLCNLNDFSYLRFCFFFLGPYDYQYFKLAQSMFFTIFNLAFPPPLSFLVIKVALV